jgi:hypothetical protein
LKRRKERDGMLKWSLADIELGKNDAARNHGICGPGRT